MSLKDTSDDGSYVDNILPAREHESADIAISSSSSKLSWGDLERYSRKLAAAFNSFGLMPGSRWAYLSQNRPELAILLLAGGRSGTGTVPLNWHLKASELVYYLQDSDAKLIFIDEDSRELGEEAARLAGVDDVIMLDESFYALLNRFEDKPTLDVIAGRALMYTGGTTGRSKAVLRRERLTARDWSRRYLAWASALDYPSNSKTLLTTPIYHSLGVSGLCASLALGNHVVLEQRFDAEEFLAIVEREKIESAMLVPTQMVRLAKLPQATKNKYDTTSLKHIHHGGGACPVWVKQELIEWFGPILIEGFGSTEGTGPIVVRSEEWLTKPGTVGKPSKDLEIAVLSDDKEFLAPNEIGMFYVRRPEGPPQYLGDPEKSASITFGDGWFTAGDMGWIDEDGYVFVADRRTDLIVTGGVNVYPLEIEEAIHAHPDVIDVAVFGVPDDEWGQSIHASVVVADPRKTTAQDLAQWCNDRLASYKCPKTWDFRDTLDREASGKLKKAHLRDDVISKRNVTL